jgi:Protein of unknown function (DUF2510)
MDYNIFSSVNSLIGILILILIIAAVVLVVRAMVAPRAEPRSEAPIVQQPVVQQPAATSGLAPGWYPDQSDPSMTRYYDGREWTSQTQPRT